jgi:phytoene/squalene synthetase
MKPTATPNDFLYCRDLTRRSGSSFYYAFRFLPPVQRDALYAVYGFCRAVDDAVDESSADEAPRLVAEWRAELDRCYRGLPMHPVTTALAGSLEHFPIPRTALEAIVDGVEMDLHRSRYETFAELELYCRRVASAVGLAASFRALMAFECERARGYYRAAERELAPEDAASLRPAEIMRRTYERVLDRIVEEEYQVFGRKVGLSRGRKLLLAASFWGGPLLS